ncbi:MAG: hypothetical protein A2V70_20885 [Planctomycetes bacterium RBG_13_63_9]|nr:MAG: hypothetical protein A2V70_20885 [Planctomycetes bacterium RBG_13_63_9]
MDGGLIGMGLGGSSVQLERFLRSVHTTLYSRQTQQRTKIVRRGIERLLIVLHRFIQLAGLLVQSRHSHMRLGLRLCLGGEGNRIVRRLDRRLGCQRVGKLGQPALEFR